MKTSWTRSPWTLMVSVLATLFPLGCGSADDPNASYSDEEDEAVDSEQTEKKVVTFEYYASSIGIAAVVDGTVKVWGGGSGDKKLVADNIVYLCLPPDTWADIWVGDETSPPPACSETPCFGVVVQVPIDDTASCLEVLPLPEE